MKSLESFWRTLFKECAAQSRINPNLDLKKAQARIENEGLSFLTITLPDFGKSFERCLDTGRVESTDFPGFSRIGSGPLPKFMGGFLTRVFDVQSGELLAAPDIDVIRHVRQVTLALGKVKLPCGKSRVKRAFNKYVQLEQELRQQVIHPTLREDVTQVASLLFADVFASLSDLLEDPWGVVGKHGPGNTADRLTANGRIHHKKWPTRFEGLFPYIDHALPSPSSNYIDEMESVQFLDLGDELPVRVIQVPKTLKTPRIIALEPAYMQYMQQAVLEPLVELLETQTVAQNTRRNLCYKMVGFTDQDPNRELARRGSMDGTLATIDLSDASDRVTVEHVKVLTDRFPIIQETLLLLRSDRAKVPGHGVIPLSKYASMGSALCFPVEAMVFLAVATLGVLRAKQHPLTRKHISQVQGEIRVYGDDIIVPVDSVPSVISLLEAFGFRVNAQKSFWTGKFRESCGGDYYDGCNVTPVRVRHVLPTSLTDVDSVVSSVELRNNLYQEGLWMTAKWLDGWIGGILPLYPSTKPNTGGVTRHTVVDRFVGPLECDYDRQVPIVKALVSKPRVPEDPIDDWPALLKWFIKRGDLPLQRDHLIRQGRPSSVDLKKRWSPAF